MKYASLNILEDAAELDAQHKRHVSLTWSIIKFKLQYYYPELVDEAFTKSLTIHDLQYEKFKVEFLGLCLKLDVENVVCKEQYYGDRFKTVKGAGMSEIDFDRPMVKASLNYIGVEKWKDLVEVIQKARKEEAAKEDVSKKAEDDKTDLENIMENWGY